MHTGSLSRKSYAPVTVESTRRISSPDSMPIECGTPTEKASPFATGGGHESSLARQNCFLGRGGK